MLKKTIKELKSAENEAEPEPASPIAKAAPK